MLLVPAKLQPNILADFRLQMDIERQVIRARQREMAALLLSAVPERLQAFIQNERVIHDLVKYGFATVSYISADPGKYVELTLEQLESLLAELGRQGWKDIVRIKMTRFGKDEPLTIIFQAVV